MSLVEAMDILDTATREGISAVDVEQLVEAMKIGAVVIDDVLHADVSKYL
jgi:hypothetical protein